MMKTMLGLAVGACADAGKFNGKLNAAKATLETSRLPILRLVLMVRSSVANFDQLFGLVFRLQI
jgi:hypothetical protein